MRVNGGRLLFYSRYAFFPQIYFAFRELCSKYRLQGFVVTHEMARVPRVYSPSGFLSHDSCGLPSIPDFVTVIPEGLTTREKVELLKTRVGEIGPDFIWAHEEPSNYFVNQMLAWFRRSSEPRIITYLAENIWPSSRGNRERIRRWRRERLWKRFNGVLACASKSVQAIRGYGMPQSVPTRVAWVPNLPPPERSAGEPFLAKKREGDFVVGFAGRITAAKGWRVLLAALTQLPEKFRCLIAGTGDEESDLRLCCQLPAISARVDYLGVLEKTRLWDFYRTLDALILPSLTTPHWTEQFGFVLAEAMACGVPVIGSDSGAIPEVIGECGMVVPENDSTALAGAILKLSEESDLRAKFIAGGLERFEREFSVNAYVKKVASLLGIEAGETQLQA